MCGDCAFRRQVGLDQVDFGVHPLEQRELFLDLHPAFLWPTADCVYSCSMSLSSCFSRISLAGSRRQLSIRKNERKGGSDEPDTPLLLERELAVGEVDVVIGGEKSNQANNAAGRQVKNPASSRALPSNPSCHQGSGASRSREPPSTLSSPPQFLQPPA